MCFSSQETAEITVGCQRSQVDPAGQRRYFVLSFIRAGTMPSIAAAKMHPVQGVVRSSELLEARLVGAAVPPRPGHAAADEQPLATLRSRFGRPCRFRSQGNNPDWINEP